ncbi:putative Porin [uncultured delta proteobacterium]|uniref:Putative Porin n=1 Tax=uncultured delta proteobacterium TaxID=34034 RepID=A0A212JU38_9DELT|nr:putative Porin [uncultured delta proteobacterium]
MKVNGQWWFWYSYATNPLLVKKDDTGKHADRVRARQRTRVQIQFIADENLSALLNLENNIHWGDSGKGTGPANSYGAINADNSTFVIKRAHLDWTIPNTQVKTRMGVQGINLPGASIWNPVLNADVAGVSVSNQFTPEFGLTAFWARPYDRNYYDDTTQADGKNELDDMDVFGVILPIKTDVVRFSPWAIAAVIGKDSDFFSNKLNYNGASINSVAATQPTWNPAGTAVTKAGKAAIAAKGDRDDQAYGWWIGTTFELPVLDPFFVKLDGMYGRVDTGDSDYDMSGWMVAGDIGYKFSFGSLSAIGFYSSGNDDDDDFGQLPIISADGAFNMSNALYGLAGASWRRWDGYLSNTGQGMWGMGIKIADVSFVDNLKHTLTGMWYGGTNKGDSVDNKRSVRAGANNTFGERQLTTSDHAWEVNLVNEYKVNENLSFRFDVGYIQLELGDSWTDKDDTKGNFLTGVGVQYMF